MDIRYVEPACMSTNPCHHDCDFTDGDDSEDDLGCCTPLPVRRDCGAPVLPVPECDEEGVVMTFDPDTETYTALSIMYDNQCSPWWTTSINDPWTALIT